MAKLLKRRAGCSQRKLYKLGKVSLVKAKQCKCKIANLIQSVNPHFYVTLYYNGSPYITSTALAKHKSGKRQQKSGESGHSKKWSLHGKKW